jgi:chloramphenicol 3-O phosphotransferase
MTSGRVIVLNGGSSSGKSSIARALQELLAPTPWVTFGVDTLIGGLPQWLGGDGGGLDQAEDGSIAVGPAFTAIEGTWHRGLAAMAAAGANVIIDDVFLSGAASQARLRTALAGLDVLWVAVRCAPKVAAGREAARGDRVTGQAVDQAERVHDGVAYDLEVDTALLSTDAAARAVVEALQGSP